MHRIQTAFDEIRADDALLAQTRASLRTRRERPDAKKFRFPPLRRAAALAAALAATLALAAGLFSHTMVFSAAAYVSIDVNPSVELTLNRMNRVIDAQPFNEEGEMLLGAASVKGLPYGEAAEQLMASADEQGYTRDDTLVAVTVQAGNAERERTLQDTLAQVLRAAATDAEVEVFPVSADLREKAHACHMSAAKYLAIQELLDVDETATLEQYSDSGIRQIRQRTRHCQDAQNDSVGGNEHGKTDVNPASESNGDGGAHTDETRGSMGRGNAHGNEHGHD